MKKSKPVKLALAMIVKNDPDELKMLERCLKSLEESYDSAFITVTAPVNEVLHGFLALKANVSFFPWVNDFSKARNFNFSQVPEEYDYIMWSDADDIWLNSDKLKEELTENKLDGLGVWYAYAHDEYGNCMVAHKKTMVVKNGSSEWMGALHEELIPLRDMNVGLSEVVKRVHRPKEGHSIEAFTRNEVISKAEYESNIEDARTGWNYGNSLIGVGKAEEAITVFEKFVDETGSSEEEYIAYMRLAECYLDLTKNKEAIRFLRIAIGLKPHYPDAYLRLGQIHFDNNQLDECIFYTGNALKLEPPTETIAVYNPRDYDYNPLLLLSKAYYKKGNYSVSLKMLQQVQKIVPKSEYINGLIKELEGELNNFDNVSALVDQIMAVEDVEERKKAIQNIPREHQNHPKVCIVRNNHFVKETSTGKDVVFYCGFTQHEWNPIMFKTKGVGGSEESIIHLSKRFAKLGYNVTVYANIGRDSIEDEGVTWLPFWRFNSRDKIDFLYLWRSPKLVDYGLNVGKIIVDIHDVIRDGEFTKERLKKIHKVMVKSHYHRSLFPSIPDDKIAIVPNGFELAPGKEKRDPMLIINTSSPDRSLSSLARNFKKIKELIPEAKCEWAYGWEIFDNAHSSNPEMMAWKAKVFADMEDAGIVNRGRISQTEVSKMYKRAKVFAYPSVFPEICCISLTKAQAGGAIPVTTSFGVFKEKNKYGYMVDVPTVQGYENGQFDFGLDNPIAEEKWVDEVVSVLKTERDIKDMQKWAEETYNWDNITKQYEAIIRD